MITMYLSKTSIGVSGKFHLAFGVKIFTLTVPGHDSGDSVRDGRTDYEGEEGKEGSEEEDGEEEKEVGPRGCTLCV
jgi:hypothetical protein